MEPTIYRIVVRGELSGRFGPAFEGMTLSPGAGETAITGPVVDQAHLHGLLDRVGDLGLELLSVNAIPEPASSAAVGQTGRAVRVLPAPLTSSDNVPRPLRPRG